MQLSICSPHLGMLMCLGKVEQEREEGRRDENNIFGH